MKGQGNLPPGITIHDVIVWIDGLGPSDRKTKTAYTWTATTANLLKYGGRTTTFNATTSLIDCGAQLVGTGNVSISAWVNPVGFGENSIGTIATNGKFALRINDTNDRVNLSYDSATYANGATNAIVPAAGTWYHIAATMASTGGNSGNIYINGALNGTADQAVGTVANGSTNLIIGNNAAASATWDGDIGPVVIFNKILTADQIAWIYNKFK